MRKRTVLLLVKVGFIFAILCFVGLNAAMKPVSTPEYCGSACHEMGEAYRAWELSVHGANDKGIRVECVDCHLPPKDRYFAHLLAKGYAAAKDMYKHNFGDEYDGDRMHEAVLAHLPNERCLHCHDDLLKKPGSLGARMAHGGLESKPDAPENRCVECHEGVGHERYRKLFSP